MTEPMHPALMAPGEGQGLISDDLVALLSYASNGTSAYAIKTLAFDHHTPQRDRRTAQLQLYGKVQALTDLYYGEAKREREIRRVEIKIQQLQRDRVACEDDLAVQLLDLDIAELHAQLAQIEDQRKLSRPLIKDARTEYEIYLQLVRELDAQDLGDPEAAEARYFQAKTLAEAKLDVLHNVTGLSRPVLEQLARVAPASFDALLPAEAVGLLAAFTDQPKVAAAETPVALPPGCLPVFVLVEREEHPIDVGTLAQHLTCPIRVIPVAPLGDMATTRLAVLRHIRDAGLAQALVLDGNVTLEDAAWQAVAQAWQLAPPYLTIDVAPTKWGGPNAWADVIQRSAGLALDPSVLFVRQASVEAWIAVHQGLATQPAYRWADAFGGMVVCPATCPAGSVHRMDYDTGTVFS